MGALRPWHIVLLAVVVLVLFGAGKLPGFARSLGQSLRIFKAETKAMKDDDELPAATPPAQIASMAMTPDAVPMTAPVPVAVPVTAPVATGVPAAMPTPIPTTVADPMLPPEAPGTPPQPDH